MKKVVTLLLAMLMVISMVACGGSDTKDTTAAAEKTTAAAEKTTAAAEKTTAAEATTAAAEETTAAQELSLSEQAIAARKASGKNTKIVLSFFTWIGEPAGTDRIEAAINELMIEEYGIEIELLVMDSGSFGQNIPLMLNSGEQVDLFSAGGVGYTTCVNNDYLYDMYEDDLIQNYGQGILEVIDEVFLKAGTNQGRLLTLPTVKEMGSTCAVICIGKEYLDGIGFDYEARWAAEGSTESIKGDWDEIDKIFAQLAEKYPDANVLTMIPGTATIEFVDNVGNDTFGVLMDAEHSLKISDLFETDEAMEVFQRARKYFNLGYFSADCLTSNLTMASQVMAGTALSMCAGGKPGYQTQVSAECGRDMIVFSFGGDFCPSYNPLSVCWGIAYNTEDPVAAMQALNAFYSDARYSNLLCRGQEGVDYAFREDGRIGYPEGVDYSNAEWSHSVLWEMPNELLSYVWETDSIDVWERTMEFNNNAVKSIALGFSWDNTDYAAEYTALSNVYNQYRKTLMYGAEDPAKVVPEMVEKLKANGLEDYMAAKQEALYEWAAANGVTEK